MAALLLAILAGVIAYPLLNPSSGGWLVIPIAAANCFTLLPVLLLLHDFVKQKTSVEGVHLLPWTWPLPMTPCLCCWCGCFCAVQAPDDEPVWFHVLQLHWLRLNHSDSTEAQQAAVALTEKETFGVTSVAARDLSVWQCQRLSLAAAASAAAVTGFIQAAWLVAFLLAFGSCWGSGWVCLSW